MIWSSVVLEWGRAFRRGKDAPLETSGPEDIATREVIAVCVSCDFCGFIMEAPCLVFPELQRLYEKSHGNVETLASSELRHFVDMCNECGICPCTIIRSGIRNAKEGFIRRDGLNLSTRRNGKNFILEKPPGHLIAGLPANRKEVRNRAGVAAFGDNGIHQTENSTRGGGK